jgi:hypothetical protein
VTTLRAHVTALVSVTVALVLGVVVGLLATPSRAMVPAAAVPSVSPDAPAAPDDDPGVARLAPAVLSHRLDGVSVLILSTRTGAAAVPGVARMLSAAGADRVGQLQLTDAFSDPARDGELLDLATAALPPSVAWGLPGTSDGAVAASALLADVLVAHDPAVAAEDLRSVLVAYSSQGYLAGTETVAGPADAVILVTGPAEAAARTGPQLTLVDQIRRSGALVVASDGAGSTLAGRVRADSTLATHVSTVDNAMTATGQLVCVWALADELAGQIGAYGQVGLPPVPVPRSATPTPTAATPSPTPVA